MPHILSVSYDVMLLSTRQIMLESRGYTVTSAEGFVDAMRLCSECNYDLLIIGHSIPHTDKKALVAATRCDAPVLALLRHGERELEEASMSIDAANPKLLLDAVARLLSESSAASN
jgi:DNA-binding response OmpR family regulator